ncbi:MULTISPECIES: hypothetical protein [unclassified Streptomyces]|uniref:hypothetical protein n=1 Tax=unclassified Streptomyces TaxID=2593676 RepID=UPI00093EB864|nr:hypothetical protein [Streptomyces sp. TSRI0107]OKJ71218.1 hypothetical protein AMK31_35785 [Streptomyces sp. TSRI0107]
MTHTPPPPEFPPPMQPEPSAPTRNRTNAIIIGAAAAVIAAVVATGIVVVQSRDDDSKPAATAKSSAPAEDVVTAAAEEPDSEPTYDEVDADSFAIALRTTERQCFGSAGCNVTVEPKVTYLGISEDINPNAVYEITYEINGDESGPVIETAELSDQTSLRYTPSLISTASSDTEVSVEITDVLER